MARLRHDCPSEPGIKNCPSHESSSFCQEDLQVGGIPAAQTLRGKLSGQVNAAFWHDNSSRLAFCAICVQTKQTSQPMVFSSTAKDVCAHGAIGRTRFIVNALLGHALVSLFRRASSHWLVQSASTQTRCLAMWCATLCSQMAACINFHVQQPFSV